MSRKDKGVKRNGPGCNPSEKQLAAWKLAGQRLQATHKQRAAQRQYDLIEKAKRLGWTIEE